MRQSIVSTEVVRIDLVDQVYLEVVGSSLDCRAIEIDVSVVRGHLMVGTIKSLGATVLSFDDVSQALLWVGRYREKIVKFLPIITD